MKTTPKTLIEQVVADDKIRKLLLESAKENLRTPIAELRIRLRNSFAATLGEAEVKAAQAQARADRLRVQEAKHAAEAKARAERNARLEAKEAALQAGREARAAKAKAKEEALQAKRDAAASFKGVRYENGLFHAWAPDVRAEGMIVKVGKGKLSAHEAAIEHDDFLRQDVRGGRIDESELNFPNLMSKYERDIAVDGHILEDGLEDAEAEAYQEWLKEQEELAKVVRYTNHARVKKYPFGWKPGDPAPEEYWPQVEPPPKDELAAKRNGKK